MKHIASKTLFAIVALFCAAGAASADIKVKTRTTMSGQSFEGTTYIRKSRQRTEQNAGGISLVNLLQCDLNRNVQLNDQARTYLITPFNSGGATAEAGTEATARATPNGKTRRGGVITYTTTINDTGERKQMFGMTARHLKVTMEMESSPDACSPVRMKMVTDGWYVDLEYGLECERNRAAGFGGGMSRPECVDEIRHKQVGGGKLGYPLLQETVMYDESGRETSRMKIEVVELSRATLEASLFEIPAGYSEARSAQELFATPSMAPSDGGEDADAARPAATADAAGPANLLATVSAGMPKKAGAVRIGVMLPRAQMTDGSVTAQAAEAVRNTLVSYLNGPSVEILLLEARLPVQAIEEARQGQCDYVLAAGLTQKKGGGGMFGKVVGSVAQHAGSAIPYGGSTGAVVARTAATTVLYTTASIATAVKAKDEVSFEYKLHSTTAPKPIAENSYKAKAKSDGEDVITPLIEKAAEAVLSVVKQ